MESICRCRIRRVGCSMFLQSSTIKQDTRLCIQYLSTLKGVLRSFSMRCSMSRYSTQSPPTSRRFASITLRVITIYPNRYRWRSYVTYVHVLPFAFSPLPVLQCNRLTPFIFDPIHQHKIVARTNIYRSMYPDVLHRYSTSLHATLYGLIKFATVLLPSSYWGRHVLSITRSFKRFLVSNWSKIITPNGSKIWCP